MEGVCAASKYSAYSATRPIQLYESTPVYNKQVPNGGRLTWRGYLENEWMSWEHREGLNWTDVLMQNVF